MLGKVIHIVLNYVQNNLINQGKRNLKIISQREESSCIVECSTYLRSRTESFLGIDFPIISTFTWTWYQSAMTFFYVFSVKTNEVLCFIILCMCMMLMVLLLLYVCNETENIWLQFFSKYPLITTYQNTM